MTDRRAAHVTPAEAKAILGRLGDDQTSAIRTATPEQREKVIQMHAATISIPQKYVGPIPKPAPRCKHVWKRLRGSAGDFEKRCVGCGKRREANGPHAIVRRGAIRRGNPPKRMGRKKREVVAGWPELRAAVIARDVGICQFCGGKHEKNTAHHVDKKRTGFSAETGMVCIGLAPYGGGFSGCHQAAHHDLPNSRKVLGHALVIRYGVELEVRNLIAEGWPEQVAMNRALERVQKQIDEGLRRSSLPQVQVT